MHLVLALALKGRFGGTSSCSELTIGWELVFYKLGISLVPSGRCFISVGSAN